MTLLNMKPYDPTHEGEFCTRDGRKVHIWATDMAGPYPIIGYISPICGERKNVSRWTKTGAMGQKTTSSSDIMCVIPRREARVITFNEDGSYHGPVFRSLVDTTFREILPDDISQEKARALQEKARALTEAAREVITDWDSKVTELADLQESIYRLRTVFSSFP